MVEYGSLTLGDGMRLSYCKTCGALCGDTGIHTKWHENLEHVASNAREGATAWSMSRPLGGRY